MTTKKKRKIGEKGVKMKKSKATLKYVCSFLLVFVMAFACLGLAACGNNENGSNNDPKLDLGNSNVLVVYFSATGNTAKVAGYIQEKLEAETLEIVPTNPYSAADLDWHNSSSRVNAEHNAYTSNNISSPYYRPQFNKTVDNFENYDVIFIGYPIWWGEAPNIVYTFLEEYSDDFAGKTIVPFCTSSSSGLGQSANHLHNLVSSTAIWLTGQRFSSGVSRSTIENWINGLQL